MRTFVIAEVAATHGGSLYAALKLVGLAREVGADAVKFQWLSDPERLVERRRAPEYREQYRRLAFPRGWFSALKERAEVEGVEFMCTAYLPEDVHVVAQHVSRFKVSSFEALDRHFVLLHAEYRKPLLVSAGMGAVSAGLFGVLQHYFRVYMPETPDVSVLHCVSAYPCPEGEIRLARLRHDFTTMIPFQYAGLSDHTRHPWTGALAVAVGARIVEFHLRSWETDETDPDREVARDPLAALEYVRNIRTAESMLGPEGESGWLLSPAEEPMLRYRTGVA